MPQATHLSLETLESRLVPAVYKVGPRHAFAALHDVPWSDLGAGDTVLVYWQAAAYHDKITINYGGSVAHPLTIQGVAGPNGELPVVEADGAVENPDASYPNSVFGNVGLFTVMPGATGTHVSHVTISGLELVGATRDATFTDYSGELQNYGWGSAGVALYDADHVTITNCIIHGCENGIFGKSQGYTQGDLHHITVDGSWIYGNGLAGSDRAHNTYIEGAYTLYQFDTYGPLIDGAGGATNLSDRGVGTIVRYCNITGGSHALQLIEPDDGAPSLDNLPGFGTEWVYGNIIVNPDGNDSSTLIQFGTVFDGPIGQRKLWFYDNTVVSYNDQPAGGRWYTYVFTGSGNVTIHALNNIFDSVSPNPNDWSGEFYLATGSYGTTTVALGVNWAPSWFQQGTDTVRGWQSLVLGDDPGFIDVLAGNYALLPDSPCIGVARSPNVDDDLHRAVKHQFDSTANDWVQRTSINDLGAEEYADSTGPASGSHNDWQALAVALPHVVTGSLARGDTTNVVDMLASAGLLV